MTTLEYPIERKLALDPSGRLSANAFTSLASGAETGNEYALLKVVGGALGVLPPHVHNREDEAFYMLRGEATFRVLDQVYRATAGSVVYLPRGLAHDQSEFSEDAELLALVTPGDLGDYFKNRAPISDAPTLADEVLRLGSEHGITFLPAGAKASYWPVPEIHSMPQMVAPGKGETLEAMGSKVRILLDGSHTQNLFSMFEIEDPAGTSIPLHIHHADSEAFYILEGAYEMTIGNKTERAVAGSFVYVPRGMPRGRRNYTKQPGRMLVISATSGHEKFYREIAQMKSYDPARLEVVARRYGIEILKS